MKSVLTSDVPKLLGRQWVGQSNKQLGTVLDISGIRRLVSNPGDRGIVFGARLQQEGHYFNVVNKDGKILFLNGQAGTAQDLTDGFIGFMLMRTN